MKGYVPDGTLPTTFLEAYDRKVTQEIEPLDNVG